VVVVSFFSLELLAASHRLGKYSQPWLVQLVYLMQRQLRSVWRSRLLLSQIAISLVCGVTLGGLFFNLSVSTSGVQNRVGLMVFLLLLLAVMALSSLSMFVSLRQHVTRERSGGYYGGTAAFVALSLVEIVVLRLTPPLLIALTVYWLAGLHAGASHFFSFLAGLLLVSFASTSMCLLLSSLFESAAVATSVATIVVLWNVVWGGLVLNNSTVPSWVSWLAYSSFVKYAFEALMINELGDLTLFAQVPGESHPLAVNGAYFLRIIGLNPDNFYLDMYLLAAYGLLMYAAAAVAFFFVKEKR
jgi:ABC-type multidrug transport system permease subunit